VLTRIRGLDIFQASVLDDSHDGHLCANWPFSKRPENGKGALYGVFRESGMTGFAIAQISDSADCSSGVFLQDHLPKMPDLYLDDEAFRRSRHGYRNRHFLNYCKK